jgi:hypothetical protein
MKIAKLETLRLGEFPNLVWVRVHTDQGVVGLGETSYAAQRHVPQPVRGFFERPPGPGVGCELLPELRKRKDAVVRASPA